MNHEMGNCPNLRSTKTGGMFSARNYTCSATGNSVDKEYASRVCNGVNQKVNKTDWCGAHALCNAFKTHGICNSR